MKKLLFLILLILPGFSYADDQNSTQKNLADSLKEYESSVQNIYKFMIDKKVAGAATDEKNINSVIDSISTGVNNIKTDKAKNFCIVASSVNQEGTMPPAPPVPGAQDSSKGAPIQANNNKTGWVCPTGVVQIKDAATTWGGAVGTNIDFRSNLNLYTISQSIYSNCHIENSAYVDCSQLAASGKCLIYDKTPKPENLIGNCGISVDQATGGLIYSGCSLIDKGPAIQALDKPLDGFRECNSSDTSFSVSIPVSPDVKPAQVIVNALEKNNYASKGNLALPNIVQCTGNYCYIYLSMSYSGNDGYCKVSSGATSTAGSKNYSCCIYKGHLDSPANCGVGKITAFPDSANADVNNVMFKWLRTMLGGPVSIDQSKVKVDVISGGYSVKYAGTELAKCTQNGDNYCCDNIRDSDSATKIVSDANSGTAQPKTDIQQSTQPGQTPAPMSSADDRPLSEKISFASCDQGRRAVKDGQGKLVNWAEYNKYAAYGVNYKNARTNMEAEIKKACSISSEYNVACPSVDKGCLVYNSDYSKIGKCYLYTGDSGYFNITGCVSDEKVYSISFSDKKVLRTEEVSLFSNPCVFWAPDSKTQYTLWAMKQDEIKYCTGKLLCNDYNWTLFGNTFIQFCGVESYCKNATNTAKTEKKAIYDKYCSADGTPK